MSKKNLILPLALVTDDNLSTAAKVIYGVVKSFQKGKTLPHNNTSVIVTHAEIIERSNLSKQTVVKALNLLEANNWIEQQRNLGSANRYIFTNLAPEAKSF